MEEVLDEVLALQSVYSDVAVDRTSTCDGGGGIVLSMTFVPRTVEVKSEMMSLSALTGASGIAACQAIITLPALYPSKAKPVFRIQNYDSDIQKATSTSTAGTGAAGVGSSEGMLDYFGVIPTSTHIDAMLYSEVTKFIDSSAFNEPLLFELFEKIYTSLEEVSMGICLICGERLKEAGTFDSQLLEHLKEQSSLSSSKSAESAERGTLKRMADIRNYVPPQSIITTCFHSYHTGCLCRWAACSILRFEASFEARLAHERVNINNRAAEGESKSVQKDIDDIVASISHLIKQLGDTSKSIDEIRELLGNKAVADQISSKQCELAHQKLELSKLIQQGNNSNTSINSNSSKQTGGKERQPPTANVTDTRSAIRKLESDLERLLFYQKNQEKENLDTFVQLQSSLETSIATQQLKLQKTKDKMSKQQVSERESKQNASNSDSDKDSFLNFPCPFCRLKLTSKAFNLNALESKKYDDVIRYMAGVLKVEDAAAVRESNNHSNNSSNSTSSSSGGVCASSSDNLNGGTIFTSAIASSSSTKVTIDPNSVAALPEVLQTYVRGVQRYQQGLKASLKCSNLSAWNTVTSAESSASSTNTNTNNSSSIDSGNNNVDSKSQRKRDKRK